MKTFNPKVSIVIPVYNGSNFLREAIDSALAQTYDNVEIIVVNDGSTDDGATEKIAHSYGDKIRYFLKRNGGVATALNYGIKQMKGEYFSWLSHDDMYEKTKIEAQVNLLATLSEKNTIVACNARVLFPNGIKKNEYIDKSTFEYTDIFLATSAVVGVNGCALLIPKKAFDDCGDFNTNLPVTQDYDLWFRLAKKYKFVLLEENLIISRRHDGQDSVQKQKLCFDAGEVLHYAMLNDINPDRFDLLFGSPANLARFWDNYVIYKQNGYKKTASMMLKQILRHYQNVDKGKFIEAFNSEIGGLALPLASDRTTNKKKIVFYTNVWHRGGIERVLAALLEHIRHTYDCILVVNAEEGVDADQGFPVPSGVTFLSINTKDMAAEIMNILSYFEADVFVGNPNISERFLDMYAFLQDTPIKTIAYNHGYYFLPYMYGDYLYPVAVKTKQAYGAADYVVWLTEVACGIYNLENPNGYYIPNPSPRNIGKVKAKPNKNIVAVGRFDDEVKQIEKTLLVFKELYTLDSEFHLDVVGSCSLEMAVSSQGGISLEDFMRREHIPSHRINFIGEQQDVNAYYDNASFLVSTSKCEGFGMVFLEAFSRGVPCASFEYLGIDEIIHDGENGVLSKPDDYKGLAGMIMDSVSNKILFARMSKSAIDTSKHFSIDEYQQRWDKLLAHATGSAGSLDDLEPVTDLSTSALKKITLEYEKLLKELALRYLSDVTTAEMAEPVVPSRMSAIKLRFKESIARDGVCLTIEKIFRKIIKKLSPKR